MSKYGVGLLAAGPVAQAIHIPAIRRHSDSLELVSVMDIDELLAATLADQHGMSWTTSEDELISNPDVHIVVVGSPNNHHARQIVKACKAGKKVVVAEKPLAVSLDELEAIRQASLESGTQIVVGTMHVFDEAYLSALAKWRETPEEVISIEVNCFIPTNDEYVDYATQLLKPTPREHTGGASPTLATLLEGGILGLAMHDIPLIRDFAPDAPTLDFANYLAPYGYLLQGANANTLVKISAQIPGEWGPSWSMTVRTATREFTVDFQPSYVLAKSARVSIASKNRVEVFQTNRSAYLSEWDEIANLAEGNGTKIQTFDKVAADLEFALSLVEQSKRKLEGR